MRHWNVVRNASEVGAKSNKTPYQFRYGVDVPYKLIPFGAEVTFKPTSPKDKDKCRKFSAESLQGIVIGYKIKAGGKPTGDVYIVERSDIGNAETAKDVHKEKCIHLDTVQVVFEERRRGRS